ncbi:1-hydroxycarotenoid 3,4-desaturase CrtD [Roseivivax sp.]
MSAAAPHLASPGAGTIVVIGGGIGGLAAALPLAAAGCPVVLLERQAVPGGKMRQVAGVDAGPTVLTLRWVFEALFASAGAALEDHVTLHRQEILARHFWRDGARLDLHADPEESAEAVRAFAGAKGEAEFRAFSARAKRLFEAFREPMMLTAEPDPLALTRAVLAEPRLIPDLMPWRSLDGLLRQSFSDPRLRQLFGRYATYVGGDPARIPALYALIWEAEAAGVWAVEGGLSALARALADLFVARGGEIRHETEAVEILGYSDGVRGVRTCRDEVISADHILFNGDPRALSTGRLGPLAARALPRIAAKPRSLSAHVWAFQAEAHGPELSHHNVFFRDDPAPEFKALAQGQSAPDPTLYVCAEDRGLPGGSPGPERFEIILNASPLARTASTDEDFDRCLTRTFAPLRDFGLRFDPEPGPRALTSPAMFDQLFPASAGSLYGQSPHGLLSALTRPRARTRLKGLYLCGGGVHPGPGVPMAALSGRHAAAAILMDRVSPSPSRRTAMPGGISTA